ncbi:MAG: ParA [Mycoplasmataceae bacterium CE_OT135]|nr:MAG: ParA [Mycoplasmataceae bacterium CE_OT135]
MSGGYLTYIKQANIILVPFIPHYVDLQVIIPWFNSLPQEQQKKVYFSPQPLPKNQRTKRRLKPIKRDETGRESRNNIAPFVPAPRLVWLSFKWQPRKLF